MCAVYSIKSLSEPKKQSSLKYKETIVKRVVIEATAKKVNRKLAEKEGEQNTIGRRIKKEK